MCGILGLFDPAGLEPEGLAFARALDMLRLRGPDDHGVYADEFAHLGHRRLAIVDLSSAGHQPMESWDRRYVIVFNGEIYNHADLRRELSPFRGWRGRSDTETLLEAYRHWGVGCVTRFNGMFAFAIYDRSERCLFLARDRVGVKPMYYGLRRGAIGFASRPAPLARLLGLHPGDFDAEALRAYLELSYVPSPMSFHKGLQKLPPGHYLLASPRKTQLVRYWDFRFIVPSVDLEHRPEGELVEELDGLVRDSVRVRLMSDVPLGAFLSGGVDSALVVAAMKAEGVAEPQAFTIGFTESHFDEGAAAARAAAHLGVRHIHETLTVDSLLALLPTYIEQYDEPFGDASAFPTLALARLARRHVTVALSGDAADEWFGGYHYYPLIERLAPMMRMRPAAKQALARLLSALPLHRAKILSGALKSRDIVELFRYLRSIDKDYPSLLEPALMDSTTDSGDRFAQYAASFAIDLSASETGMRLDAGLVLPELFLQKVDVATMAFSLEARCPMTDFRLVEWAMRLPLRYKLRGGDTKYLLRKVLLKYLPAEHVYRRKMGFGVPIAAWLRGPLRTWASDMIYDDTLLDRLPLRKDVVRDLLNQHLRGARQAHPLLWSVLMLLCFVQKSSASLDSPAVRLQAVA